MQMLRQKSLLMPVCAGWETNASTSTRSGPERDLVRAEHQDCRRLSRGCARCDEQPVEFRNKQASPCSRDGGYTSNVRVLLPDPLEYIDVAAAANDVEAVSLLVKEHVITVPANVQHEGGNATGTKAHNLGGVAEGHPWRRDMRFQCQRKIRLHVRRAPGIDLLSQCHVDHGDLPVARDIHEGAPAIRRELESFGMRPQGNVSDPAMRRGVDQRQCTVVVACGDKTSLRVEAQVVDIAAQWDEPGDRQIR